MAGKTTGKSPRSGGHARRQRHAHTARRRAAKPRRWSAEVMRHSDALDLEHDIFKNGSPQEVAESLKRSATASRRRKGTPFQSAMSMLNFYINRAGRQLPAKRRAELQKAKQKLREVFGRA
ncbi:hypothetical protein GCM10023144_20050 [Pigmentiphaga soli]|uniref:DUF3175 domain-containing protein n=1 Tax=Pigmentiphaga soli TaxID=1007095 RepID=A0ABP8GYM9_9BURK